MLWMIAGTICVGCLVLGVLCWKRGRRVWGAVWFALGLVVAIAPLPTLSIKVELPPAARR